MKERKLTDKEERIAQSLPDKEFKKRYGKDWKSVKIATATKMAKMKESVIRKYIKEQIKSLHEGRRVVKIMGVSLNFLVFYDTLIIAISLRYPAQFSIMKIKIRRFGIIRLS